MTLKTKETASQRKLRDAHTNESGGRMSYAIKKTSSALYFSHFRGSYIRPSGQKRSHMKTATIKGSCEHGKVGSFKINLPLTIAVLDIHEWDTGFEPEYAIWLMSKQTNGKPHYLTTVSADAHQCKKQANLVAAAFNVYLKTKAGQAAALRLVRHHLA
jgi:hypothetical protein